MYVLVVFHKILSNIRGKYVRKLREVSEPDLCWSIDFPRASNWSRPACRDVALLVVTGVAALLTAGDTPTIPVTSRTKYLKNTYIARVD